jgi:hypothetical protein
VTGADQPSPVVGAIWAYRAIQACELVPVKVIRHGKKEPARVFVQFVDDEFEGQEDWVPPARLKIPWHQVAEYQAREDQWKRAPGGMPVPGRPTRVRRRGRRHHAAGTVRRQH